MNTSTQIRELNQCINIHNNTKRKKVKTQIGGVQNDVLSMYRNKITTVNMCAEHSGPVSHGNDDVQLVEGLRGYTWSDWRSGKSVGFPNGVCQSTV